MDSWAYSERVDTSKFAPMWEGRYVIREVYDSGYFFIFRPDSENLLGLIGAKWLKLYYS